MEIVRVETVEGEICYGCEVGNQVFRLEGDLYGTFSQSDVLLQPVRRLAPVVPTAIYGIGLNYREHAAEVGAKLPDHPVVFMKSPASVQHPNCPIILPRHLHSDQVDYECELAVVIGRDCKNVSVADALDFVLGYTCGNDVSARDWQKFNGGGQWVKAKSFDSFCPLGPGPGDRGSHSKSTNLTDPDNSKWSNTSRILHGGYDFQRCRNYCVSKW